MTLAEVRLWGERVGAVALDQNDAIASFEYAPSFVENGSQVAPLMMPLREGPYDFPSLGRETFSGLPGMLADALPDRWGNALIDAWLARQGRTRASFDAVERLCYVGQRAMGALEFAPATGPDPTADEELEVGRLADLAAQILSTRGDLRVSAAEGDGQEAMEQILRVGSSAGGARAKALVAFAPESGEFRSGQVDLAEGFEHWILKFDGVKDGSRDLGDARGYGLIELAYSRLAAKAGIEMEECRVFEEGDRSHFMTRRFDRMAGGAKVHMQSLGAMQHLDFNQPGANGYEQAFQTIRELGLPRHDADQQFRRMAFNVIARNQDDHVKNIAFLMDENGGWRLSPAFDVTYAYNPDGDWTTQHQMSVNGKRDGIALADFEAVGELASMKRGEAKRVVREVAEAVRSWPEVAEEVGVDGERIAAVERELLTDF